MPTKGQLFKIGSTWVADPAAGGINVTDEPVWSSNTGRSTTGKMIGDIVAWKKTIEVKWPPLTFAQVSAIRSAIKSGGEFFDISYYDLATGSMKTTKVYCGNIPRTLYSLAAKHQKYFDVAIKFVEQ